MNTLNRHIDAWIDRRSSRQLIIIFIVGMFIVGAVVSGVLLLAGVALSTALLCGGAVIAAYLAYRLVSFIVKVVIRIRRG